MKKEMPERKIESDSLYALPHEALKWELLKTALELNLFDRLSVPSSAETISTEMNLHPENTEHLLNALVALGCLTKKNDLFSNTAETDTFLTSGKDTSLGASMLYMAHWITPMLNGGLMNCVRNGPPPPHNIGSDEIWKKGAQASLNHSRCGRAQYMADLIAELPEFPAFRRMADLGAGPGIIGIAVTARHPSMSCVLVDQPAVCRVADEVIAEYGMADRVSTFSGSYMEDDFGSGYDFIMANYTLNFYRARLPELMSKVLNALNSGGVFLVTSDGISRDKTAPAGTVLSWLSTALQGHDMSFTTGLVASAMRTAGCISTEVRTLENLDLKAHGPIELTIGRKQ